MPDAGLFYLIWEKVDQEELPYVLVDIGETYLDRIHVAWLRGAYDLMDEVPLPDGLTDERALSLIWEWFNRGSGNEHADLEIYKLRSLSIGDIVRLDGRFYVCRSLGWERILVS